MPLPRPFLVLALSATFAAPPAMPLASPEPVPTRRSLDPVATVLAERPPREWLTQAKVRADLGHDEEALALYRAVADSDLQASVRGEALARLGTLLQSLGRHEEAIATFQRMLDEHAHEPEVMRFLVLAVEGVAPIDGLVEARSPALHVDRSGDHPVPRIRLGDGTAGCFQPPFEGQPISINVERADVEDVFRLLAEVSGRQLVLDSTFATCARPATMRLSEVPWDEVFAAIIETQNLRCSRDDEGVLTVSCAPADDPARQRGLHERTLRVMRTVLLAANAHRQDEGAPPRADELLPVTDIAPDVEPAYVAALPRHDAWGGALLYRASGDRFLVASPGPDGALQSDWAEIDAAPRGDDIACVAGEPDAMGRPEITCRGMLRERRRR